MLREAWSWLTTPCPVEARRLGYLRESIATAARARRCAAAWAEHLRRCRELILAEAPGGRCLRLLGAEGPAPFDGGEEVGVGRRLDRRARLAVPGDAEG